MYKALGQELEGQGLPACVSQFVFSLPNLRPTGHLPPSELPVLGVLPKSPASPTPTVCLLSDSVPWSLDKSHIAHRFLQLPSMRAHPLGVSLGPWTPEGAGVARIGGILLISSPPPDLSLGFGTAGPLPRSGSGRNTCASPTVAGPKFRPGILNVKLPAGGGRGSGDWSGRDQIERTRVPFRPSESSPRNPGVPDPGHLP